MVWVRCGRAHVVRVGVITYENTSWKKSYFKKFCRLLLNWLNKLKFRNMGGGSIWVRPALSGVKNSFAQQWILGYFNYSQGISHFIHFFFFKRKSKTWLLLLLLFSLQLLFIFIFCTSRWRFCVGHWTER